MSALSHFTVRHLNDLHRGRAMIELSMKRCSVFSEKFDAYNAAHVAVVAEIHEYRRFVAEACSPWFDNSAFQQEQP